MLQGINVEEIKKYNESLRAQKDRASKLRAEIEFNTTELNRICQELTAELGIQVTPENIDTIYNDRVSKINSTLETGKEILKRVAEEEAAANQPAAQVQQPAAAVQPGVPPVPVFAQAATTTGFANTTGGAGIPGFADL